MVERLFSYNELLSIEAAEDLLSHRSKEDYTEAVDMSSSGLNLETIALVVPLLFRLGGLRSLNLSNNHIDDRASEVLSACLIHMQRLEALNLSDNQLSHSGADIIAKSFFPCLRSPKQGRSTSLPDSTVYFISLSENNLMPEGCLAVAEALRARQCKAGVALSNVGADAAALLGLLRAAPYLASLDLSDNPFLLCENYASIGDAVRNLLQHSESLASLDLSYCCLSPRLLDPNVGGTGKLTLSPRNTCLSERTGNVPRPREWMAEGSSSRTPLSNSTVTQAEFFNDDSFVGGILQSPGALKGLRALHLAGSSITDGLLSQFIEGSGEDCDLQLLDVSYNYLVQPDLIRLGTVYSSLTILDLSGNMLEPSVLTDAMSGPWKGLRLSDCDLSDEAVSTIADNITKQTHSPTRGQHFYHQPTLPEASEFYRAFMPSPNTQRKYRHAKETLARMTRLLSPSEQTSPLFFVSGTGIQAQTSQIPGVRCNSPIVALDISYNRIRKSSVSYLTVALNHSNVSFLDVEECCSETDGLTPLNGVLRSQSTSPRLIHRTSTKRRSSVAICGLRPKDPPKTTSRRYSLVTAADLETSAIAIHGMPSHEKQHFQLSSSTSSASAESYWDIPLSEHVRTSSSQDRLAG
ncbi:MAG: hypothetical protein KVP17_000663 [Porospora cf. gigantea B]|uniref:uncharacterized protein n=1 Tax=Porospora cf. gigantea B TaxID=2853592 RepID=UPI003571B7BF|nr:MAG: hypothetical protein KVP17_000663 [Porospora cf. gigantea B]